MKLHLRMFFTGLLTVALAGFAVPSFAYNWQKVAPKNAGFSADFPGKPVASTNGDKNDTSYFWMYGDKARKLLVLASTSDYNFTPDDADAEMNQDEANFLEGGKGKVLSHKRGKTRGANGKMLPSLDFSFVMASGWKGISKVIVDGSTIYMTVVMWGPDKDGSAVGKRFMASYRLVPRKRP